MVCLMTGCQKEELSTFPSQADKYEDSAQLSELNDIAEGNKMPLLIGDPVSLDQSDKTNATTYGPLIKQSPQTTATAPYCMWLVNANGSLWTPQAGYSYAVELELLSGDASFKLYGKNDATGAERREETNGTLTTNKKVIYFSASKLQSGESRFLYYVFPNTPSVTFVMRFYKFAPTGVVYSYAYQGWTGMANYLHSKQATGSHDCGPNSYMIARHLVKPSYQVSANDLTSIRSRSGVSTGPVAIDKLKIVANQDFGTTKCELKFSASTARASFYAWLKDQFLAKRTVIVPLRIVGSTGQITTTGNVGHYVVLVGMDLTSGGTGSNVYYKDGLFDDSSTKTVDLSTMLDAMAINSAYNGYNALSLYP